MTFHMSVWARARTFALALCVALAASLVGSLAASSDVGAEELPPQLDDLVEHFVQVVFGQEYQGIGEAQTVLARWDKGTPVGITLQGRKTQPLADMAGRRLGKITQLTGVRFRQIQPGEGGPSIDLLFMRRAEMGGLQVPNTDPAIIRSLASDPTMVCFFLSWKMPPEKIVKAIVVIDVERDPVQIDSCLLEELTQVMGLPNDVKAYWTTLFNPVDMGLDYSPWDALYLRTLYGPRMMAGMRPKEVRAVVRPIFAEALSRGSGKP